MTDAVTLIEIDARIAAIRANLSALTEQAASLSGAADEDRAAARITEQQEMLDTLIKQREALAS